MYLPTLNDRLIIAQPKPNSENEKVWKTLWNNVGKTFIKSELKEIVNANGVIKDLPDIVRHLGFKGEIKKLFLETDKNNIRLISKEISKEEAANRNLDKIKISTRERAKSATNYVAYAALKYSIVKQEILTQLISHYSLIELSNQEYLQYLEGLDLSASQKQELIEIVSDMVTNSIRSYKEEELSKIRNKVTNNKNEKNNFNQ